jgi:mRNA interferase MazF
MSSANPPYCPDSGDIIEIDLDPQAGREQAGMRPALVLSPKSYNQVSRLCVLCPMTNQIKGYPFEVLIPSEDTMGGGAILSEQVKSLSWEARRARFKARVTSAILADVLAKIKALIQIS